MKRYLLSFASSLVVAAAVLAIYWCGGGNFVRGESLGMVVYAVETLGGLAFAVTFMFSGE